MNKLKINRFCHPCNDDRDFALEWRIETRGIRGVDVTVKLPFLVCPVCGHTQPDDTQGVDQMVVLYDEYRKKTGMLMPEQIREIRSQYGLSHEAFAKLLGMSPATLIRYEGGGLQDQVHDELLRMCRRQENMEDLIQRHADQLTSLQLKRYHEAVGK